MAFNEFDMAAWNDEEFADYADQLSQAAHTIGLDAEQLIELID